MRDLSNYDNQDKAEVEYAIKIRIKKDVEDKIRWFTHNYKEEISAYLTGEIKGGEVIIDGMLFPHQDVTSGSVDTEGKNLVKMRKEYGDECLRIIGHWHSHNTMGAFWSGTDDEFIKSYSLTKEICVFFVSSTKSRHRVKLVMNKPFEISLDNLDYEIIWNNQKFEKNLRKIIDEKVTKKVYETDGWEDYKGGLDTAENSGLESNFVKNYSKVRIKEAIKYSAETGNIYVKNLNLGEAEGLCTNSKGYNPEVIRDGGLYEVLYKTNNKQKAIELIREIKLYLEEMFEEELNTGFGII